jgi:hypothetical protein
MTAFLQFIEEKVFHKNWQLPLKLKKKDDDIGAKKSISQNKKIVLGEEKT